MRSYSGPLSGAQVRGDDMARRITTLIVSMIVVAGSACQRTPITAPETSSSHGGHSSHAPADASAVVNGELAELRQLVAHYHDLDDAMAAGYSVAVTPCLALPGVGGMGFHYGNPALINDPAVRELEPELLLYEPQKNGEMRFVGVEYIIPFALR